MSAREGLSDRPIITVFGATGAQGGGLARALLADAGRHFAVRAVTRKPDGAAAAELSRGGGSGAGGHRRRLQRAAGNGGRLWGFLVTNFWEHQSAQKELVQAATLAAAAAQAGVRHSIWSTLEDTRDFFAVHGTRMPVLKGSTTSPTSMPRALPTGTSRNCACP